MSTIPQSIPAYQARNVRTLTTAILTAQRDWLLSLQAQQATAPQLPALLAEIDAELARRTAQVAAALAGIIQRPSWAGVKP